MKRKGIFTRVFGILWLSGLLLLLIFLCYDAVMGEENYTSLMEYRLLHKEPYAADEVSLEAKQLALTFQKSGTVALLDADDQIISHSQEFLVLRDGDSPRIALLPELTEEQRSKLISMAEVEPKVVSDRFAAVKYERYHYTNTVYFAPHWSGDLESSPVNKPITLELTPTAVPDVFVATLSEAGETCDKWLPYLRFGDEWDMERLMELVAGAEPTTNLFRWEQFVCVDAPEDFGAARIAAYEVRHPLWDTFDGNLGEVVLLLFLMAFASAVIALAVDWTVGKVRKKVE